MPLDQDIEFLIELKPSTAPIYKTPFRMTTLELAKLKEHIKELLERIYSPWIIPMGSPHDFCPEEGWYSKVVHGLLCPE
jgi:hypothetical protein